MTQREIPREGRTLVLLPDLPVADDWARASALSTRVVRVTSPRARSADELHSSSSVSLPATPPPIQLRPKRFFWRVNAHLRGQWLLDVAKGLDRLEQPVHLVHSHFLANSTGLPRLAARRGIPYVVSEHSSGLTRFNPEKEVTATSVRVARFVYENAAAVLPVSHYLESEIRRRNIGGRFIVVPNPVDTELFRPGRDPHGSSIITVARLTRVKQLDLLLRAVALLTLIEPRFTLTIVGDGPERDMLGKLASKLAISDRVTFVGRVDRRAIPELLSGRSLFAMTSYTENLPVAMLEALACGLPAVGPRAGGIPEILEGAPGETFEPGNVESLKHALLRWMKPSDVIRSQARQIAVNRYSIPVVGRKLSEVYLQALSERPASARP